jgi:hypothetical protein
MYVTSNHAGNPFGLLQIIATDAYKAGFFYFSGFLLFLLKFLIWIFFIFYYLAKAYDLLVKMDPEESEEFIEGKRF